MTKTLIDYQKLAELCRIDGLTDNKHYPISTEHAHQQFMSEYDKIFAKRDIARKVPAIMNRDDKRHQQIKLCMKRTNMATGTGTGSEHKPRFPKKQPGEKFTFFEIADHMARIHKQKTSEDKMRIKNALTKNLRKLLCKFPFERTALENETLYGILRKIPDIADQMPDNVLKEICLTVQMDRWKEPNITIFGNLALYMVMSGSVRPLGKTYLRKVNAEYSPIASPTLEEEESMGGHVLGVGECFGTLVRIPDVEMNSHVLSAATLEPNCELLKISTSDYARIIEQIENRDQVEKMNLLQSSGNYKHWTRQPLQKVASLFTWTHYPPNTVIATEGTKAPFIAFIKSGECHVLCRVNAIHTLKNGKKENRVKQVVMGKLSFPASFGEDSIMGDKPIIFSVVSATDLKMAVINPDRLCELDETTKQLLHQSCSNAFANLKETDIHDEFIAQELKREWNEFKHGVVMEVINDRAVRPGVGKWRK